MIFFTEYSPSPVPRAMLLVRDRRLNAGKSVYFSADIPTPSSSTGRTASSPSCSILIVISVCAWLYFTEFETRFASTLSIRRLSPFSPHFALSSTISPALRDHTAVRVSNLPGEIH